MQFVTVKSKDMYLTESYKNFSLTPGIKLRLISSQTENPPQICIAQSVPQNLRPLQNVSKCGGREGAVGDRMLLEKPVYTKINR